MTTLTVTGEAYHSKKSAFKKLLADLGVKWCGTIGSPEWRSDTIRVIGDFLRDEQTNMTLKATIQIEGDDANGIQRLVQFFTTEMEAQGDVKKECQRRVQEFNQFEIFFRPDLDKMERDKAPGFLIGRESKEWNKKRKMKMLELGVSEAMIQGIVPTRLPLPIDTSQFDKREDPMFTDEDLEWAAKCKKRAEEDEARKRLKKRYKKAPDFDEITGKILDETGHQEMRKTNKTVERQNIKNNLRAKLQKFRGDSK